MLSLSRYTYSISLSDYACSCINDDCSQSEYRATCTKRTSSASGDRTPAYILAGCLAYIRQCLCGVRDVLAVAEFPRIMSSKIKFETLATPAPYQSLQRGEQLSAREHLPIVG